MVHFRVSRQILKCDNDRFLSHQTHTGLVTSMVSNLFTGIRSYEQLGYRAFGTPGKMAAGIAITLQNIGGEEKLFMCPVCKLPVAENMDYTPLNGLKVITPAVTHLYPCCHWLVL